MNYLKMKEYEIVIKPQEPVEPGFLGFLSRLESDWTGEESIELPYAAEYVDVDENMNEVHHLRVRERFANWVESQLDMTPAVISYKITGE